MKTTRETDGHHFQIAVYSALILLFTTFSHVALSQVKKDTTALELAELSIEELMQIKVVTASKIEESIMDAPSSITVFTKEQIENMGIRNVYELLDFVPGFQATRDIALSEIEVIHVRGIGGLKPYVLVKIDGERVNDLFIERGTQFLPFLSVANVKQVEVIAGPASALYGSDAVLGILHVITEKNENEFNVTGGSQGSLSADGLVHTTIKKHTSISASAFYFKDNGYEYTINGNKTNDARSGTGLNVGVNYKSWMFNVFYYDNTFQDFIKFTNQVSNGFNKSKTSNAYYVLGWKKTLLNKLDFRYKSRYIDRHWIPMGLVSPAVPEAGFSQPFYFGANIHCGDIQNSIDMNYRLNKKNQLMIGVSHRYAGTYDIKSFTNYLRLDEHIEPNDSFYLGGIKEFMNRQPESNFFQFINITSLYSQYKISPIKSLKVNLGMSYDYFEIGGSALNPRIGAVYTSPFNLIIKGLYGSGFRSPSYNELFSNDPVTVGNSNLKPEVSNTIELGFYKKIRRSQTVLTLFKNSISNIIKEIPSGTGPATFVNSDSLISSSGLELSYYGNISRNIVIGTTYTFILEGREDSYPQYGSFHLNYRLKKWNFNINGVIRDKIKLLPDQDPYMLVNAKIIFALSPTSELFTSVYNLTGQNYFTYSERLSNASAAVPNRGREWVLGLKIKL